MNAGGVMTPTAISDEIKLSRVIVRKLIEDMVSLQLVESQGLASTDIKSDIRYALTDRGKRWALEAMAASQYVGPAPVRLDEFTRQIRSQGIQHEVLHKRELTDALGHLVLPQDLMGQIGPAANSARSVLLYGEPGNGKTSIAEALGKSFLDTIAVPYAVLVGNQIMQFYDETLHELAEPDEEAEAGRDPRWLRCRRPVVITGGELTLDMLDLAFDPLSRFYEAPVHLKALGGVFVIDDFGRQRTTPREILNRWIVPLEKGYDILALHTGKKFTVPFDQLVIFSTNMLPEELSDGAALRRIYFKIHVPSPTKEDYVEIFRRACNDQGLAFHSGVIEELFDDKYERLNLVPSGAHPQFLVSHILAACTYLERPPALTKDLLELAWHNVAASRRAQ